MSNLGYLLSPTFQFVNTAGKPLTGGYINVYIHGSRDKYFCASDFQGNLHPFNIPLDSLGASIVLAATTHSYDVYVYNRYGSLLMSRYNVIPATRGEDAITDIVNITSEDHTVNINVDGGTNWDLSVKDSLDALASSFNIKLAEKKDIQEQYSVSATQVQTVKTITQDANGEINVEFQDIELPQQVPNVDIISTDNTIDVSSSINVETNTKIFDISYKAGEYVPFFGKWSAGNWTRLTTNNEWQDIRTPTRQLGRDGLNQTWLPEIKKGYYRFSGQVSVTFDISNGMTTAGRTPWNEYINIELRAVFTSEDYGPFKYWSLCTFDYDPTKFSTEPYQYNFAQESIRQNNWFDSMYHAYNDTGITFQARITTQFDQDHPITGDNIVLLKLMDFCVEELDKPAIFNGGSGNNVTISSDDDSVHIERTEEDGIVNYDLSVDSGADYTAGDGIDITDNEISVRFTNDGTDGDSYYVEFGDSFYIPECSLETGPSGELVNMAYFDEIQLPDISAGSAINIDYDPESNNYEFSVNAGSGLNIINNEIVINSEVGDVVATVEKLKRDLDTQITVNFDIPNITHTYDFANRSISTLTNGAGMLCQAFTIPINHDIRVTTVDEDEPTFLGIYAKQQFGYKIMLALYVYDFESGYTDYVGDTGPVYVNAGRNEYPLVHKNPNITELTSSCVYYASLYLPSNSQVNGLYLASTTSYSNASYINATPRFTVGVENITYNNAEIDMSDANTGRLDYHDGQGNYYIGPWTDSYNERPDAPRFFMQVRNGTPTEHYEPAAPFTTLGSAAMPTEANTASALPNFTPGNSNSCFRDVTPDADCDITYFEWLDSTSSAAGWANDNCVYNSGFDTNLSGNNNSITNLGQVTTVGGQAVYRHRLTFGSPLHLTANTTYRFLCECFSSSGSYIFNRTSNKNTIHVTNNGWYIELNGMTRYNDIVGKYLKVNAGGVDYEI